MLWPDEGNPRPFLKWAGGKRQLLPALLSRLPPAGSIGAYHEPFVGGGALFFALYRAGWLDGRPVHLSDSNEELINAYRVIRDDVNRLLDRLEVHKAKHDKDYYYEVRADVPEDPVDRAARTIYLNKTCFNGLYRVNSKGLFNVPIGRNANPLIVDRANLVAVSKALRDLDIRVASFEDVLQRAKKGDFVYFDPPYDPVSRSANFTSYGKHGFGPGDQEHLAEVFALLAERGVKALLSNSSTDFIKRLYARFTIEEIPANRAINSKASRRGPVMEVLVRNY